MKATNTPAQCLAIAKTVESTIETEKPSKSFFQNINKPESTEVDAVSKKKGFKGPGHKQSRGRQQFQMQDYDSINIQTLCFMIDVCQTAHTNIVFDEISSDRKLQCLPTDVKLSDNSGASSTVRIKLDTGACGNLLPLNIYRKIHPLVSVKICVKLLTKGFAQRLTISQKSNSWVLVS